VSVRAGNAATPPAQLNAVTLPAAAPQPAPAAKPESKPEPKLEAKREAKPEPKPEPKSEQPFALASSTSVPVRLSPSPKQPEAVPAVIAQPAAPAPALGFAPTPAPVAAPVAMVAAPQAPAPKPQQVHSGWMIQVGAYQAEQEAKQRLAAVQNKASKILSGADPFTETVDKGGTTYYRARFAGLDKDKAEAACKYLKRNDVDCVPIKN
jgi:D-alanyl-D-alanine carboxypeptidase